MADMVGEPKVTTKIDWKNFFLALFIGTTLISIGIVAYYRFELNKIVPNLPITFVGKSGKTASPSAEVATPSAQEASPASEIAP